MFFGSRFFNQFNRRVFEILRAICCNQQLQICWFSRFCELELLSVDVEVPSGCVRVMKDKLNWREVLVKSWLGKLELSLRFFGKMQGKESYFLSFTPCTSIGKSLIFIYHGDFSEKWGHSYLVNSHKDVFFSPHFPSSWFGLDLMQRYIHGLYMDF